MEAINHLNLKTNSKFKFTDTNLKLVIERLSEPEVTLEGVKEMIDRQYAMWSGSHMQEYMRISTLFRKSKFDGYYAAKDQPVLNNEKSITPAPVTRNTGTYNDHTIQHPTTNEDDRLLAEAQALIDAGLIDF